MLRGFDVMKKIVTRETIDSIKDQVSSSHDEQVTMLLQNLEVNDTASGATVYLCNNSSIKDISASALQGLVTEGAAHEIVGASLSGKYFKDAVILSPSTFIISAIIAAIGNGEKITLASSTADAAAEISNQERSSLLKAAIAAIVVEELSPLHAWKEFEEESLAATYHELGAQFIKLGDFDSALEILAMSDRFEDSPRSLALRGLISKMKGETLDAVANMVSSLQQYEKRKTQEEPHYLIFRPQSFDIVNEVLKDGLNALNQRDNENALSHFAKAVFEFDGFYQLHGIDKKI